MLEVKFKDKLIVDVFDLMVEEGVEFFKVVFFICDKMEIFKWVGLDYIKVG